MAALNLAKLTPEAMTAVSQAERFFDELVVPDFAM
jgi:hypothetical protein